MSHRKSISDPIVLAGIAGILVCIVLAVIAYKDDQSPYVIASLVGSFASFTALVIALIQLRSIERSSEATKRISEATKRISEATNEAVKKTKNQILHVILLSEVSAASPLIDLVEVNAKHNEYDLACLRLGVIRSLLINCNANGELRSIEDCGPLRVEVETHISNLKHDTSGPRKKKKKKFKPSDLNKTLLRLKNILKIYELKLIRLTTDRDDSERNAFDMEPE